MADVTVDEDEFAQIERAIAEERRREVAVEHLLFKTLEYVERLHPGLLDHIEASLPNLGDHADADDRDDDAVRAIAQSMIDGARRQR